MKALENDEQCAALIARLQAGEGEDDEIGEWIEQLEKYLRNPNVISLIFHSKETLPPEQIIAKAREYKPITLGPPGSST